MAADAKTVAILVRSTGTVVSVSPGPGQAPYVSAELLGGGTKTIDGLPAQCQVDERGRRYLEIEAGTVGVGPTYRLYPAVEEAAGLRPAHNDHPVEQVVLLPNTGIGLYDEWEDDLGVPWAYPLEPLKRCRE